MATKLVREVVDQMVWNEKQRGDLRGKRSIESEYIQNARSLKLEVIVDRLQKPCWINRKMHSCLDGFRADPNIVLTWQVLWRWPVGHADGTHR